METVVAMVVLSALAIAGASFLASARGNVLVQRNKRAAVEAAVSRMELVRASTYAQIAPTNKKFTVFHIVPAGGSWSHSTANPNETVMLNGRTLPISSTVQYVDAEAGQSNSWDFVKISVAVGYRLNNSGRVQLDTYMSP